MCIRDSSLMCRSRRRAHPRYTAEVTNRVLYCMGSMEGSLVLAKCMALANKSWEATPCPSRPF
eukprot:13888248-Alexandrium_andersonii.AAC.1